MWESRQSYDSISQGIKMSLRSLLRGNFLLQVSVLLEERSDLWQAECVCSWANIGVLLNTATHTDEDEAKLHGFLPEFSPHHSSGFWWKEMHIEEIACNCLPFELKGNDLGIRTIQKLRSFLEHSLTALKSSICDLTPTHSSAFHRWKHRFLSNWKLEQVRRGSWNPQHVHLQKVDTSLWHSAQRCLQ